jgi:hypothetical protein
LSNNDGEDKTITISENQGDIIGVGVSGSGHIIGKNISVVINEYSGGHGLTLIPPNYFKENTDTEEDLLVKRLFILFTFNISKKRIQT